MGILPTALVIAMALPCHGEPARSVSGDEARQMMLNVIPLPKEVRVDACVTVPVAGVRVTSPEPAAELVAREIQAIDAEMRKQCGPAEGDPVFTIIAGQVDASGEVDGTPVAECDRMGTLPNKEQAYCIQPTGENGLIVAGLNPEGVFYGLRTLRQLVLAGLRQRDDVWMVDVPLLHVLDWPDMAERGEWGGSVNRDIEWMSAYKMNLCESHCRSLTVMDDGHGVADFDKTLIARGADCAVKVVPIITHLDQLERTGLFRVFPDTLGKGDPAKWPYGGTTVKPACFSNPKTAQVLADWMVSLAEQPEVTDINVWLSEHHVACECEDCKQKGQFMLEAEAIARGYELAKQRRPDIRLRVLLTQGSYEFNNQVIAGLPREIGITYYDGGRTYDSSRNDMIYPLLEDYARSGGWLGCYPQLTASWRIVCPWSGPQFIRARMNEFVDDGLVCLCGYATPDNRFYDFNVVASAEWSWNAKGRDEREFALAYFTCRGVADPEKAADWAVMLGPVGWDIYGARVPYSWFFGRTSQLLRQGKLPPLGQGPFAYLPDEAKLAANLAVCSDALALAREVGDPALIQETLVIDGYMHMLKAIHELSGTAGGKTALDDGERALAEAAMSDLDRATVQTTQALLAWRDVVTPGLEAGRFEDTVRVTDDTCAEIGEYMAELGVRDAGRAYRGKQVGRWVTEDFADAQRIKGSWDVTDCLDGPGEYLATFLYETGWYGLTVSRASLVAEGPDGNPTGPVLAVDEHPGEAGYVNRQNVYSLSPTDLPPGARILLVADISGMPRESPPDKQGCTGRIVFAKKRPSEP